jgi:hypothetical protein
MNEQAALLNKLEIANLNQCTRSAFSNGPNIVGVFPPHLRKETNLFSEMFCLYCFFFFRIWTMVKVQTPSNLSVIQHRQNPLESIR